MIFYFYNFNEFLGSHGRLSHMEENFISLKIVEFTYVDLTSPQTAQLSHFSKIHSFFLSFLTYFGKSEIFGSHGGGLSQD